MVSAGERIVRLRWAQVDDQKKRHLWLGQTTACGLAFPGDPACWVCWAYAEGWVDRHVLGQYPPPSRSPLGAYPLAGPTP